jgi:ketosteroid isomerase-like protein
MAGQAEIEIAKKLFAAWSSGNPDDAAEFLTEDAVLHDIVEGSDKVGWPAIREFFSFALKVSPDLVLEPNAFWVNDEGVAVRWHMSATVTNDMFGPEAKGKKWHSDGMSTLEFRDGKVCREVDYHHGGAIARSLGIKS